LKREKCLYHPGMKCPAPEEPCVFAAVGRPERNEEVAQR
jgi:hypothetical protein